MPCAQQTDEHWMHYALQQAHCAADAQEVPVGAVVIEEGCIIGAGYNQPISSHKVTAHAELLALEAACLHKRNYRLPDSTLYVTLEPCIMCVGAMLHARISRVVFATSEPLSGAVCSRHNLLHEPNQQQIDWHCGVLAEESTILLQTFFSSLR